MIWRLTCMLNDCGRLTSFIPTSSGVALPLRLLQRLQLATRLSQFELPPRDFGKTWSSVSSDGLKTLPQYWQV